MADRDEVIKGIMHHKLRHRSMQELNHDECFDCPYRPDGKSMCESIEPLLDDILELLKEQEKQKFFVDENGKITPLPVVVRCKDCIHWSDQEILKYHICTRYSKHHQIKNFATNQDWFCADGKRKSD